VVDDKYVNVRISEGDLKALQRLTKEGYFMNVSDAVRTAIRKLIEEYKSVLVVEHPHGGDKKETVTKEV
jgi:Arc/MetJ-type ribon-helix-helix transcriptional regulator